MCFEIFTIYIHIICKNKFNIIIIIFLILLFFAFPFNHTNKHDILDVKQLKLLTN